MSINRRAFLGTAAFSVTGLAATRFSLPAHAAGPITIGVMIPGSRTDHGWMESAYNGMKAAEARHGSKVKVTYIENVKFADMEQALVFTSTQRDADWLLETLDAVLARGW